MLNSLKKKPDYHVLQNGYIIPRPFLREFERSCTYIPDDDDMFICTYPKCGSTWTQCILYLMLNKGEPLQPGHNINTYIAHLEDDGKDVVEALPRPRIIKTHLPCSMLPKNKKAKYIFVARNPKDCCVSFYHHTKGFKSYDFVDGEFGDYFDLFLAGQVDYGDYFDYLLSFLDHKSDLNMLFLLYEEMKYDTQNCIKKIGNFLGGPFFQSCEDPTIIKKILQNCSFETMKATHTSWISGKDKDAPGFFRKGEVGDWRRHFTAEQAKLMDEKFKSKFAGTEAEYFWNDFDC